MTTETDTTVLDLIQIIYRHRQEEKAAKQAAEGPANLLKAYLSEADEKVLVDGEHGLQAKLQERSGTEWDLRGMNAETLYALQTLGLLRVDNAAFETLRKTASSTALDDAARYRRQIIGSVALIVEPVKP